MNPVQRHAGFDEGLERVTYCRQHFQGCSHALVNALDSKGLVVRGLRLAMSFAVFTRNSSRTAQQEPCEQNSFTVAANNAKIGVGKHVGAESRSVHLGAGSDPPLPRQRILDTCS
jgi:hypothetical protein